MTVIDLPGDCEDSWSEIDFGFFFLFLLSCLLLGFNFCHWESLKVVEEAIVVNWAVDTKEVITWLAVVIICSLVALFFLQSFVKVVIMIFFSRIVVTLEIVAISSILQNDVQH